MERPKPFFDIEQQDEMLILTPEADMGELDFERVDAAAKSALELLGNPAIKYVIMDFHKTDFFSSTALGFFVRVWKTISTRQGRVAFCNVSDHEKEILKITKLDTLWDVCASKDEALLAVRK